MVVMRRQSARKRLRGSKKRQPDFAFAIIYFDNCFGSDSIGAPSSLACPRRAIAQSGSALISESSECSIPRQRSSGASHQKVELQACAEVIRNHYSCQITRRIVPKRIEEAQAMRHEIFITNDFELSSGRGGRRTYDKVLGGSTRPYIYCLLLSSFR